MCRVDAFVFGLLLMPGIAIAGSVGGTGGATEITQIANNTQLMMSYVEQAQQTITQFNQYQTMLWYVPSFVDV